MAGTETALQDPVDAERARLFALLGHLMGATPDAVLLARLARLEGGSGELGEAYRALAEVAAATDAVVVEREYFTLFIGIGRGEILPYASYYLTGFLHERPLADLRGDLARLGIARAEGVPEPEDHIAFLCETYAGLIAGSFAAGPDAVAPFFARHIRPWAARLFGDLEKAEAARFYKPVGRLGRLAVEIEAAAADLPA